MSVFEKNIFCKKMLMLKNFVEKFMFEKVWEIFVFTQATIAVIIVVVIVVIIFFIWVSFFAVNAFFEIILSSFQTNPKEYY